MKAEEWQEIAREVANYVDGVIDRKLLAFDKQPWSYGQVMSIELAEDEVHCDILWCEVDGQTEQVPVLASAGCTVSIGDYVLIVAVNNASGDRVAVTQTKRNISPPAPLNVMFPTQEAMRDDAGKTWTEVTITWEGTADLFEITIARVAAGELLNGIYGTDVDGAYAAGADARTRSFIWGGILYVAIVDVTDGKTIRIYSTNDGTFSLVSSKAMEWTNIQRLHMFIDSVGVAHLLWNYDGHASVRYIKFDVEATTWDASETVLISEHVAESELSVELWNDVLHIAFVDMYGDEPLYYFYVNALTGVASANTYDECEVVSTALGYGPGRIHLAVDVYGYVFIAFQGDNKATLYSNETGAWVNELEKTGAYPGYTGAWVVVDKATNIAHFIYLDKAIHPGTERWYYTQHYDHAVGWTEPEEILAASTATNDVEIALGISKNSDLYFMRGESSGDYIAYRVRYPTGEYTDWASLDTPNGELLVSWQGSISPAQTPTVTSGIGFTFQTTAEVYMLFFGDFGLESTIGNYRYEVVKAEGNEATIFLPPGTDYVCKIRGINHGVTPGEWSNEVLFSTYPDTTAPDAPTGLAVTGGYKSILVRWTNILSDQEKDLDFIYVYVDTATIPLLESGKVDWDNMTANKLAIAVDADYVWVGSLEDDTEYFVKLEAVDFSHNRGVASLEDSATTLTAPEFEHGDLTGLDYASAGHTGFSPDDHSHALDDLDDVNAAAPNDTQVLTWDEDESAWVAADASGGAEALDELTDVEIDLPAAGEILQLDIYGVWRNYSLAEADIAEADHTHSLDDLSDVDTSGVADGEILMYEEGVGWIPAENPPPGPHDLDSHSDVTIALPVAGDILQLDLYGEWRNYSLDEAGIAELSDLEVFPVDINRCGFVNNDETTIAFDDETYEFTLTRTGASFSYYRAGIKCTIEDNKDLSLVGSPPDAGIYFIYIDDEDGTLTADDDPWTLEDTKIPVAIILWDDTKTPKYWLADERHTCLIDRRMHAYEHFTSGVRLMQGGTLDGPSIGSDVNANKTCGISEAIIADEDLWHTLTELLKPDGATGAYVVMYRTDADSWTWVESDMPFPYGINGINGYIEYDDNGTMTEGEGAPGSGRRWYNSYLLYTNLNGAARFIVIPGRGEYLTLAGAQRETPLQFSFEGLPIYETVIAYQLTWGTSNYSNKGKCVLGATPVVIDISVISVGVTGTPIYFNLDDLLDVNAPTPSDGDVLVYDDTENEWVASSVPAPSLLDDIGDVNAPAPGDGDVLAWDDDAGEWINAAAPPPGAHDLDSHSDVTITLPAAGEILQIDMYGIWRNYTPAEAGLSEDDHTHALDDLSDVDADAPDDRDVLAWNDDDNEWQNLKEGPVHAEADGANPQIANLVFGTGDPPDAATVPEGTIWIKYTA